ncbi:MAG: cobalt-precorrin 5A hydrolase [Oscillospiraceae bacterium]|nr:cobalt-precorrin 5A hydrolase [Oscillospiraceae bacterium]
MTGSVFAYSARGCETARRVCDCFSGSTLARFAPERLDQPDFTPIPKPKLDFYGKRFESADILVFVSSCGIAVREIAPYVRDKRTDPAVLVVDERGTFVISLLSGHIGGANEMAKLLAETLGAVPVITTATDVNGKFSVDSWAAKRGYVIGDMKSAKAVSAAILEGNVPLLCDFPISGALPSGVVYGDSGKIGIYVGAELKAPFDDTLQIVPRVLHLGIGCRRGISEAAIEAAVGETLDRAGLDRRAIKCAASIDIKSDEQGLIKFCENNGWPLSFYDADTLRAVEGDFTPSPFVTSVTGVDNVCERAAMVGAAGLLVRKTALNGVTVAVAAENLEVNFE